ncbi:MAG: aldo/keto reductase [Actinomycetes bacterium]
MARHSEKVKIKRTGLEITRLGLGTAPLGGLFNSVKESDSDELIATAFEQGINFFDTAPLYGHGRAEIRLGRGLRAAGKPFVLSTKVGRVLNAAKDPDIGWFADADKSLEPIYDYSADGIKRSIEESLKRLGVDHIDIALMHDADDHIPEAINKVFPALAELRSQGVINAVGMGMNWCAPSIAIMKDTDLDIALIAGRFSLLDQDAQNELFPLAIARNASIIIGGVYNSGVLANPNPGAMYNYLPASDEIIARARKIGAFLAERNVSLTAAALQFPLRHPAVTTVLTGSRSKAELLANIADYDSTLPPSIWSELEAAGLVQPLKV